MLGTQIWTHTHVLSGILILGLRLRIVFGWWLQVRISFSIPTKGMKITNDLKRGLAMGPTSVIRTRIYNDIQLYQILVHAIYIYIYIYMYIHMHIYTYIYRCPSKRRDDVVFARPWCNGIQIAAVLRQRFFITRILRHQQGDEVKDP